MKRLIPYVLVFVLGFIVCAWTIYKFFGSPGGAQVESINLPHAGLNISKSGSNQVRDAAKVVSDYVVNIDTIGRPIRQGGPLFPFFGGGEVVPKGQASGVLFTSDGYVLTNNHVVAGTDKLTVTLHNGKSYQATVVGSDPKTDVAVVKIPASGLTYAKFGNSNTLQPGDWVIAVGSPFQLQSTVTVGVVSAKRNSMQLGGQTDTDVIQTDAPINPGNSGGALADLNGNLVGINSAIFTPSGGSVGIGFAIPSNTAKRVAEQLIKFGQVKHPWLGIKYVPYNAAVREELGKEGIKNLPDRDGILLAEVIEGSPAADAGLRPNDILLEVNGKKISPTGEPQDGEVSLSEEVSKSKVGDRMTIKVWHSADRQVGTISLRLGNMPAQSGGG